MMPWIVLTAISLILDIFKIIQAIFTLVIMDIISSVLAWMIAAYFLLVVWSYKDQVQQGAFTVAKTSHALPGHFWSSLLAYMDILMLMNILTGR